MDIYRATIIDHYKHPRNFGKLVHPTHTAQAANATCGDKIRMDINIKNQKSNIKNNNQISKIISEIKFTGTGCAISMASASMLTEAVIGKPVNQVLKLRTEDIITLLGTNLTPSRIKCATLPLEVLHKALVQ